MTAAAPAQIKAIHVLKSQSGLSDADYRAHLRERFEVASSKDLTFDQAGVLMDDLRALGGRASVRTDAKRASGKYAPVLQALWLAGYHLGVVENPDDAALLAFVKRQCKVDHDRFLTDGAEAAKAIEALKSWIGRDVGVKWATKAEADRLGCTVANLNKQRVIRAIELRLVANGLPGFDIESYALLEGFGRVDTLLDSALDKLAAKMGAMLRERLGRKG
jgi:D-serine deaminase-like pyridoxal phosphate-dependent protein